MLIPKAPKHRRIKPKYNPNPNEAQKRYWKHERAKGCEVCKKDASIHHITTRGAGRITKDHWLITPLCPEHHQGNAGIHMLGHFAFIEMYHIDLFERAVENLELYCEKENIDLPIDVSRYMS